MGYSTKYQSGSALSSALGVPDDAYGLNYGAPLARRAPSLFAYPQYAAGSPARLGMGGVPATRVADQGGPFSSGYLPTQKMIDLGGGLPVANW